MFLADHLGKFEHEVMENLGPKDLNRWTAFLKIKAEKQRRAQQKGASRSKGKTNKSTGVKRVTTME